MKRHINLSEALRRAAEIGHYQAQKEHEKRLLLARRGGKRKNSGRKPGKRRKRCTVDMLLEAWALIDQQRGAMSRGRWIESVLRNDLAHSQKGRERGPDNTQD